MPKLMGSPRFVLVVYTDKELVGVTASESNSREEFRRLKSKAKDFVVKSSGMTLARVIPEDLTTKSFAFDLSRLNSSLEFDSDAVTPTNSLSVYTTSTNLGLPINLGIGAPRNYVLVRRQ